MGPRIFKMLSLCLDLGWLTSLSFAKSYKVKMVLSYKATYFELLLDGELETILEGLETNHSNN